MLRQRRPVAYTAGDQHSHDLREVPVARRLIPRLLGLMGRRRRERLFLVLPRCTKVHTWFMRSEIDLVFLSRAGIVLNVIESAPRWRSFRGPAHTAAIVELPPGHARELGLARGDLVSIR